MLIDYFLLKSTAVHCPNYHTTPSSHQVHIDVLKIVKTSLEPATDDSAWVSCLPVFQDSIWAETKAPGASLNINSYRRSLQREHLRKMIGMVLRDASVPEDARTMARHHLVSLRSQLQGALTRPGINGSLEVRAHLSESIARI